jgi:hypothetical protein
MVTTKKEGEGITLFIRIKKRKVSEKWFNFGAKCTYDCVLVESYRNVNGKVRQHFLKHLGTIRDREIKLPHVFRKFYKVIGFELAQYGLPQDKISQLLLSVESRLGRMPTEEEAEEYVRKAWEQIK